MLASVQGVLADQENEHGSDQDHGPTLHPEGIGSEAIDDALDEFKMLELAFHRQNLRVRGWVRQCVRVPRLGALRSRPTSGRALRPRCRPVLGREAAGTACGEGNTPPAMIALLPHVLTQVAPEIGQAAKLYSAV